MRKNNLFYIYPKLVKEWHPTKNKDLHIETISSGSNKKAWWVCSNGHEWQAVVNNRTEGKGCPYCSNKRVHTGNSLLSRMPELSKEWHPTKNGTVTPKEVTWKSSKKAWWMCKKNHQWEAMISNRTRGAGCPICSGRQVHPDNCLTTKRPDIAKEWHPTKNKIQPQEVTPGMRKTIWWLCPKKHEWQAQIASRTHGSGCPVCAGSTKEKANLPFYL